MKSSGASPVAVRPALLPIWGIWLATLLLMGLLSVSATGAWIAVFFASVGITLILLWQPSPLGTLFVLGFLQRMAWMVLDLQTGVPVFSSGADSSVFAREALAIYNDHALISGNFRGGGFSKVSAMLFVLGGPHRVVVQFTNVLLGTSTVILLAQTLDVLRVRKHTRNIVVGVVALMPIGAILQSIFLREAPVSFFVAISVYGFALYLARGSATGLLLTLGGLLTASYFHAGVIGLAVGYFVALLLYDQHSGRFQLSVGRLAVAIPLTAGFTVALLSASNVFLKKFRNVESFDDIAATAGRSIGGSAYSETKEIEGFSDFGPQVFSRAINFVGGPYPWRWRGLEDVVAFTLDATVFIAFSVLIVMGLRASVSRLRSLLAVFTIMLVGALFIFAVGTGNTGTAMRHRQKLVVPFAVAAALAVDARDQKKRTSASRQISADHLEGLPGGTEVL